MADIILRLGRDATIVTGNQRLARVLHQHYNQSMIEAGHQAWQAADILPWNAWMQRMWQEAIVAKKTASDLFLLDPHQERQVWHQILQTFDEPLPWLTEGLTVTRMMAAAQTLRAWHIPLDTAAFSYNDDSRFFWKILMAVEHVCEENGWLAPARLPDMLLQALQAGGMILPGEVALIGFDELAPQQITLLQELARAGCVPEWLQFSTKPVRTAGKLACTDHRDELRLAAQWMRQRLEEHPNAQIGLVVPELSTQRAMVCRVLDEILCPAALQPGCHELQRPYNLSLGLPLIQYPLINSAFELLALHAPVAELTQISRLLRASFLTGWTQESSARALLDAYLRETGEWDVPLQTVLHYASQRERPYHCPILAQHLKQLFELTKARPAMDAPGRWAQQFSQWLTAAGWPGDHTLTSAEYQAMKAWQTLLQKFVSLDWVARPMTLASALGRLKEMAASTIFQPESSAAPIQVLGLLETNGLQFDYLWITGLNDSVLPAPPQPNPFIPLPLQRLAELPRSSASRELRVAGAVFERLIGSASEVILSYPQRHQDMLLAPSPLIAAFSYLDEAILPGDARPTWQQLIYQHSRLQRLTEDPAPPLAGYSIPGGSHALKLQAACPFRAFAELRLGARQLGKVQLGLNARVRGNLLHRLMEKIWLCLESHDHLIAFPADTLNELIANKVTETIQEIVPHYRQSFGSGLQVLEFKRLFSLACAWLDYEKQRPSFQVIEREKSAELNLGGRQVRVRIDRIDALHTGEKLLIDYKTGISKIDSWFGERPDEPQLPLYSLVFQQEVAGIAFAQIRIDKITFKGVAIDDAYAPDISSFAQLPLTRDYPDWSAVMTDWQQTLEKLAADFIAGLAEVNPKQYPQTCTHCTLQPLCRIDEQMACQSGQRSARID
ncbi:MAG: PD-(D/E)XK nuclease family protein [Nitrosomonas sp.]|nr:PD-(D/E)XK nuclease family protein [Nitrosomonas sp.]